MSKYVYIVVCEEYDKHRTLVCDDVEGCFKKFDDAYHYVISNRDCDRVVDPDIIKAEFKEWHIDSLCMVVTEFQVGLLRCRYSIIKHKIL